VTEPRRRRRLRQWLITYLGVVVVVGLLSGILWHQIVKLPSYTIGDDFQASFQQAGWAEFAGTDVALAIIGLIAGLVLGGFAWFVFHANGAWSTLIAGLGAVVAALICLLVGQFIGPHDFDNRIANADPGDLVKIDFAAHTWVPLTMWIGAAMLALLIGSAVRREHWISHVPDAAAAEAGEASL